MLLPNLTLKTSNVSTVDDVMYIERWCTTPFFTRTKRLGDVDQSLFLFLDAIILILNMMFSFSIMKIIKVFVGRIRRKPCMWLLYHLAFNDVLFTIISQTFYAVKLMLPKMKCSFDLTAMFLSTTMSNTSIALIVAVTILRYMNTKYLLSMRLMLTLKRARLVLFFAFLYGTSFSSLLLWGSVIDNVYVINLPPCLTDIAIPILIPIVYSRAKSITRKRRSTAYGKIQVSLAEATFHRVTVYTLLTYVPFRFCFFLTSTFKMIYTVELENDSTYYLQFFHSCSYLILCMTPIGNSILYVLSDRRARRIVYAWFLLLKNYLSRLLMFNWRGRSVVGTDTDTD